jgi:hypothetical protein
LLLRWNISASERSERSQAAAGGAEVASVEFEKAGASAPEIPTGRRGERQGEDRLKQR